MGELFREYRVATADVTTHIGLLIATYDVLAEDIRLAGLAAERGEIADRCRYSAHAMLLLGHLETWVDLLDDPALQQSLKLFYGYLRSELLKQQGANQGQEFLRVSAQVSEMRAAWQQKQTRAATSLPEVLPPEPAPAEGESRFCWSA